jgi:uncharacterized protein YgiM (DUF1202 family)
MIHTKRVLFCWVVAALSAAAAAAAAPATAMSVQIRKAELRESPSFLARIVSPLAYGDRVTVLTRTGAWMQVSAGVRSGWVHASALTTKTIVMSSTTAQTAASSGELALAGKGFNDDVEAQFKANHKDIDFTWVDKMETIRVPVSTLAAFAADGKLATQGGAQ